MKVHSGLALTRGNTLRGPCPSAVSQPMAFPPQASDTAPARSKAIRPPREIPYSSQARLPSFRAGAASSRRDACSSTSPRCSRRTQSFGKGLFTGSAITSRPRNYSPCFHNEEIPAMNVCKVVWIQVCKAFLPHGLKRIKAPDFLHQCLEPRKFENNYKSPSASWSPRRWQNNPKNLGERH